MNLKQFLAQHLQDGETYAGLVLGQNGEPSYHLFLRPEKPEKTLTWADAMAWAKSIGYELPTRQDQSLLFANCQSEFKKAWYWSCEQSAHNDAYAWVQDLDSGYQSYGHKSDTNRARAVRRVPLCDE